MYKHFLKFFITSAHHRSFRKRFFRCGFVQQFSGIGFIIIFHLNISVTRTNAAATNAYPGSWKKMFVDGEENGDVAYYDDR